MKDFFKKHPELLFLLIAVIVICSGIIWMSLGDLAHTAKSKKELDSLIKQADNISTSKMKTSPENASNAEKDADMVEEMFKAKFLEKLAQYKYIKHPKEVFSNPPNAKLNMQKLLDNLIEVTLKDKDKTKDKLSFNDYYQKAIMDMKDDKISRIFEILNGFTRIANSCADAEITSIDSVLRPNELEYAEDKKLGIKTYTYIINVTGNGRAIKRLLNKISSDEKYFYEISSIKLNAVEQVTVDDTGTLAPTVGRAERKKQKTTPRRFSVEDLEKEEDVVDENEVFFSEKSIAPFTTAENKVELTVDWIQFVKTTKKEKKKR